MKLIDMAVGKPLRLSNMALNETKRRYELEFQRLGIEGISLIGWTDPPNANPDLKSKWIYLMRAEGLSEDDISGIKESVGCSMLGDTFVLNPMVLFPQLQGVLALKPYRATKKGWETMQIGESRMVAMHRIDLRNFLCRAMLKRGFPWVFRVERMPFLDDTSKAQPTPAWSVTRIR